MKKFYIHRENTTVFAEQCEVRAETLEEALEIAEYESDTCEWEPSVHDAQNSDWEFTGHEIKET